MGSPSARHMFGHLHYEKTIDEITAAMREKINFLLVKVADRKKRIARIRAEFDISDAAMIKVLSEAVDSKASANMSYSVQNSAGETTLIGAGVIQNILTENKFIEQETEAISKMERVVRNLRPVTHNTSEGATWVQTSFTMTEDELEYLGF